MASLIKSQILKHLSKFTKNLSPDKINVSTLRGEGELSNLELDEAVLTEILDLPSWLRLSKAVCNKVAIKIQWTKLKSQPICLFLDEITVHMDACEVMRANSPAGSPVSNLSAAGKYGFAERIIDGMYVSINSVIVNFKAAKFAASIQMSRIIIQSKTPTWDVGDLRLTRLKDELRGEILIFKEAEWQTLRIEANALDGSDLNTTPLRLIANQSKIRITIKKRLIDCGLVASRLQVNLDDLLWVLTDSQLKAALSFANSLKDVIKRSNQQSKLNAAEKLKRQGVLASPAHQSAVTSAGGRPQQQPGGKPLSAISKLFIKYDVVETSYHLYTGRVDLHLCDDMTPLEEGEKYKRKVEGGAMQVTLLKMCLDYYPFHPAGADRCHWLRHDENMAARDMWAQDLMSAFKEDVKKVRDAFTSSSQSSPRVEQKPSAASSHTDTSAGSRGNSPSKQPPSSSKNSGTKLLESSMVFRLQDFVLFRVSTATDNRRSGGPKKFLSSEKKQLLLPPEMSSVHVEYTDYYFPEGIDFPVEKLPGGSSSKGKSSEPHNKLTAKQAKILAAVKRDFCYPFVPHPNMYIVINPIKLTVDFTTVLWLNAFSLNLFRQVDIPEDDGPRYHTDIKLDALMPRIVLPSAPEVSTQSDRPTAVQIQLSRACITNCRSVDTKSSYEELDAQVMHYNKRHLYKHTDFPNDSTDFLPLADVFEKHVNHLDHPYYDEDIEEALLASHHEAAAVLDNRTSINKLRYQSSISSMGLTYFSMRTDSFKKNSDKDVWCVAIDQFWMEFIGVPSSRHRPVPFVESFPVTVWLGRPLEHTQATHACHSHSSSMNSNLSDAAAGAAGTAGAVAVAVAVDPARAEKRKLLKDYYSTDEEDSPPAAVPPPPVQHCADIHMLVKVGGKVSAQINHYQMLFLLRLMESISKFSDELEEDTRSLMAPKVIPAKSSVITLSLQEAEVALIGPPLPEMPSRHTSDSQYDMTTVTEDDDMTTLTEEAEDDEEKPQYRDQEEEEHATPPPRPAAQPAASAASAAKASASTHSMENGLMMTETVSDSQLLINKQYLNGSIYPGEADPIESPQIHITDSGSIAGTQGGTHGGGGQGGWSSPSRASSSTSNKKQQADIKKSFNSAFNSLQRGLGSSVSKISEKVSKMSMEDGDEWERSSIRSGSDEDEDYILLRFQNEAEKPAFDKSYIISHSDEESLLDAASTYSAAGSERARGVVSIVSFRVFYIEAKVQLSGKDMAVAAQIDHLQPVEHGNVNLDQFQAKLAAVTREVGDVLPPPALHPPILVRWQVGPAAEDLAPTGGERGYLRAHVNNLRTNLRMSSINIITDLIEDEKIPPIMPMFIMITDTDITLKDDKPPTFETSPGGQPIDLHITRANITRTEDGCFHIKGDPAPAQIPEQKLVQVPSMDSKFSYDMSADRDGEDQPRPPLLRSPRSYKSLDEYRKENELLTRQLASVVEEQGGSYAKLEQQNIALLAQLAAEQEEMINIKEEREHLLATIQFMQGKLDAAENNRYRSSSNGGGGGTGKAVGT